MKGQFNSVFLFRALTFALFIEDSQQHPGHRHLNPMDPVIKSELYSTDMGPYAHQVYANLFGYLH